MLKAGFDRANMRHSSTPESSKRGADRNSHCSKWPGLVYILLGSFRTANLVLLHLCTQRSMCSMMSRLSGILLKQVVAISMSPCWAYPFKIVFHDTKSLSSNLPLTMKPPIVVFQAKISRSGMSWNTFHAASASPIYQYPPTMVYGCPRYSILFRHLVKESPCNLHYPSPCVCSL
jgi:hypothetical protein